MALSKREREALAEVRRLVTLERASLTPPKRAAERGYVDFRMTEPAHRPLIDPDEYARRNPDLAKSDAWTNDVAETLRIYIGSNVLPIIDALIGTDDPLEDVKLLAAITPNRPLTFSEWNRAAALREAIVKSAPKT
jgi:hypothetical protein